ncbi:hemin-degrading factor [Nitratireductor kimnyeongensis]|uniref:Hemin-degrading factor n=1 Tax=Nitratireductor kimnyeongensis TaxID=430679 RepID=A0ABW0T3U3_9HYPH|nr:ChuX/HutX family heme-like substrate-binding protein [Nitratireductor kimnyeongensis]QZZ35359.1 hemin-degrading factor [Nitratireductor kimnyeongensis]
MNVQTRRTPEAIRRARDENPKMRERDLAAMLGISEAELLAAYVGHGVTRIEPRVADLLPALESVGEVMALTRNESAVHEKVGVYEKITVGAQHALVLGRDIDLRVFPSRWAIGFALEKHDGDGVRRSLQFFDKSGDAVHKVHLRPSSNLYAYQKLVEDLLHPDQQAPLDLQAGETDEETGNEELPAADDLRERWSAMTDVHQLFNILRKLNLTRHQAVHLIGEDYAWRLQEDALTQMLYQAVDEAVPIMCFVGSSGCIQIHTGTIETVKPMGPWINILDPGFNLHLRTDHVKELWAVRKPTKDGHVTSMEAYSAGGQLIAQFFGERLEGHAERTDWRSMVEGLPRLESRQVA